jgi:hypothetical protein
VSEELGMPGELEAPEELGMPGELEAPEELEMPGELEAPGELETPEEPKTSDIDADAMSADIENLLAEEVRQEVSQEVPEENSKMQDIESMLAQEAQQEVAKEVADELPEPQDADSLFAEEGPKKLEHLTDDQKAVFSYFVPVKGMEDQLCQALTGAMNHICQAGSAGTGNIIIQGGPGCGKTVLATSMIKVLQKETGALKGKIGKINAASLNTKDIQTVMRKVAGGCLIIEHAGELNRESAITLSLLMANDTNGTLVIMEDTSKGIRKALALDDGFAGKFSEKVTVPIFTNDELVSFAKSYAKEQGYEIDEMAVLALYNRIGNIQKLDQETTLTEVKEIVDEAIEREGRIGLKKYFSILTAKRYTDDDCILLLERHFQ